MYNTSTRCTC